MTKYFVRAAGEGHTYYNVPENGWKMGTGPYYMDSYDPVSYRVVLKANNDYWGGPSNFQYPIGTPKIKEIDFNYVECPSHDVTVADAGAAGNLNGSYSYQVSYVDVQGNETNAFYASTPFPLAVVNSQINLSDIRAVVGRGGLVKPIESGIYEVNQLMKEHLKAELFGSHACNLGALIAADIVSSLSGAVAYIVDPVVVDELQDIARISGHPAIERKSIFHALNQKAVARVLP
jgi:hypothetical protein